MLTEVLRVSQYVAMSAPLIIMTHCHWIYLVLPLLLYTRPHLVFVEARGYDIGQTNEATDCSYHFMSQHSKRGSFSSPHYPGPYPGNLRCKYSFQGERNERVQLQFHDIDLNYDHSLSRRHSCDEDLNDAVIVVINTANTKRKIARYCFNMPYHKLMSSDNTLEVDFRTHNNEFPIARGFNATYRFVSDFGITTGLQDQNRVCSFHFFSYQRERGIFTSPNFPGLYPRNTECTYEFFGQPSEIVDIKFPIFDVEGMPPRCDDITQSDYVEFSNSNISLGHKKRHDRLCGQTDRNIKKPIRSHGPYFRVLFKSNSVYDARGFEGIFHFQKMQGGNTDHLPLPQRLRSSASYNCSILISWILPLVLVLFAS